MRRAEVGVHTGKKIFAVVIIALSILGIVLCVGGILGTWIVEDRLSRAVVSLLSSAEEVLQVTANGLNRISTDIQDVRDGVANIDRIAKGIGDKVKDTNLILAALEQAVSGREFPRIQRALATVQGLTESVIAFNRTLEAVNSIPGIEVPTMSNTLRNISDRIDAAVQALQDLADGITQMKTGVVDATVDFFTTYTAKIETVLKTVQADVQSYLAQVQRIQAAVTAVKARVPVYFAIAALAITLALLLFLWGQARLLIYGLAVWQTARMSAALPASGDTPPQLPASAGAATVGEES
jgi:hypothetical protein